MTSDKKRREVAKRLRVEADYWRDCRGDDDIFYVPCRDFMESLIEAFGFDDMRMHVYEAFDKLADLIDRPMCRNLAMKPADEFLCSKCGEHVDIAYIDNCDDYHAKYCPNCGARVVDDD